MDVFDKYDKYIGQVFDKRYRIIKIIGAGGMAVVFEAFDTVLHRTIAIKMLKEDTMSDAVAVKRFVNESKAISMVSHPNIVKIYDLSVKDDCKYITMERIYGITLKKHMNKKGALSLKETLSYSEQILRALEHAHSMGIIHRDIKPQNIMLLENGRVKVADFGIAKLPNAETITMTDQAIGTVFYISPEQASSKPIDPRSDLYSLGILMYEMITGKLPFTGDNPVAVALMQVTHQPQPPRELNPNIPVGLEQIIMRAIEKNPERRFQNANQMMRQIIQLKSNPSYVFKTQRNPSPTPRPQHSSEAGEARRKATIPKDKLKPQKPRTATVKANNTKRRRKQNSSMLPIIAGITAAFLIIAGLCAIYIFSTLVESTKRDLSETHHIENFIGKMYDDEFKAERESEGYYRIHVEEVYDADTPENTIIGQSPKEGEARKVIPGQQYCDLMLTVSMGVQRLKLPDFTIMEYRAVEEEMKAIGLTSEVVQDYHDTILSGYVVSTDPAPGDEIAAGGKVTLHVSKGQHIVETTVPNFIGKTEAEAMQELTNANLGLGNVEYEKSNEQKGTVIWQSVAAYTGVPEKATTIDFKVSLGQE